MVVEYCEKFVPYDKYYFRLLLSFLVSTNRVRDAVDLLSHLLVHPITQTVDKFVRIVDVVSACAFFVMNR